MALGHRVLTYQCMGERIHLSSNGHIQMFCGTLESSLTTVFRKSMPLFQLSLSYLTRRVCIPSQTPLCTT